MVRTGHAIPVHSPRLASGITCMPSTYFCGRAAWTLETQYLRITVLECGGHLAEMILREGERVNPLWTQSRPTIDSDIYDPATHGAVYGSNPESRLLSGLAGHNLCFPFWGPPSPAEFAAGMTFHGETNIRRWHLLEENPEEMCLEVILPQSAMKMRRRIGCRGYALHCESEATNLSTWDRPFAWCEHVTIGPPFLESNAIRFDASLTKGFVTGDGSGPTLAWPLGFGRSPESRNFDLSTFSDRSHQDLVNSFLVDPCRELGFFTAFQPRFDALFGYVFPRADFPWLNIWENNSEHLQARGMEFGNTPHHGTIKTLIGSSDRWGVPVYEWLDALSSVRKRFVAFLCPVPHDFRGTADLRLLGQALQITERGTARTFEVPI